jgi:hypothetical protein
LHYVAEAAALAEIDLLKAAQVGQKIGDFFVIAHAIKAHFRAGYDIFRRLQKSAQIFSVHTSFAFFIAGEYLKSMVEPAVLPITPFSCGAKPPCAEAPI